MGDLGRVPGEGASSVRKDAKALRQAYFVAGVTEYWLVDARHATPAFQLLQRGPEQYEASEIDAEGYQHSSVMGRWYRLDRSVDSAGEPEFDLRDRP